jgi:hypothetical protein
MFEPVLEEEEESDRMWMGIGTIVLLLLIGIYQCLKPDYRG